MKFLFVEDEVELVELYQYMFDRIGLDYEVAYNGEEALEKVKNGKFDYIFSDIRMPKMNGIDFLKNLIIEGLDFKKFIFVTAHQEVSLDEVKELGAHDILYKPIRHQVFMDYIQDLQA
ncbi:response regulator [Halobacteriovorax sp. GFR7]|uniref:response regulator n=1 Tax=unclassified Halobacteriovorax TaxID=2639665 RepID=UPI00371353DF